jgi:urease accessory protein
VTVVCDGAVLESRLRVRLAAGADAVLREVVVLGRHGERGGRYRGELSVDVDGDPVLAHSTLLDGADPVLCGPAGTGGARTVGTLVLASAAARRTGDEAGHAGEDPGVRWAWTELAGPGRMLLAVGDSGAVTALLDAQTRSVQSLLAQTCPADACSAEPPRVVIPAEPSHRRDRGAATAPAAGR